MYMSLAVMHIRTTAVYNEVTIGSDKYMYMYVRRLD